MTRRAANPRRAGVVLIVVLWMLAVLTVLCLALAGSVQSHRWQLRRLRTEGLAEQAMHSALATAREAVLLDDTSADALTDDWAAQNEGVFVRDLQGRTMVLFSIAGQRTALGLSDESARLNANTASVEMLARLPGMDPAAAAAFVRMRDALDATIASADPNDLAAPSAGLTGPIAEPSQLAQMLEAALAEAGSPPLQLASETPGPWLNPSGYSVAAADLLESLTLYSRVRNSDAAGRPRVNINTASKAEMLTLIEGLDPLQAEGIVNARATGAFQTIGQLLVRDLPVLNAKGEPTTVRMSRDQFAVIADHITTSGASLLIGRVNVNTAGREVLMCLPGVDDVVADQIISYRRNAGAPLRSIAWLLNVVADDQAFAELTGVATTRTQQFRVCWALLDDRSDEASYGRATLERDLGHCEVLISWRYRTGKADPRHWLAGSPR